MRIYIYMYAKYHSRLKIEDEDNWVLVLVLAK